MSIYETKTSSKPLKAGIWYTISNFLVKGMVFLTTPIFTRIMTSSDIGLFSDASTWITILAIVATFELASSISIARFDFRNDLDAFISSNLVLGTIITGILYSVVLFFHNFFEDLFKFDFDVLNLVFIYLLVYPAMQMFQMKKQIQFKYVPIVVVSLGSTFIATGFSLLGVFFFTNPLKGRIFGYYLPLIMTNIGLYIYLIVKGKKVSFKYWKYGLLVSLPLIFHLLAAYLLTASDRLMITRVINNEATALYSVAYSCAMIISLLWSSMNNAWSPWAYQMMDTRDYVQLKSKSKCYTLFFLLIVFGFLLIGPETLYVMGGKTYMGAVYVIPAVGIGYIFQFFYSFYVNIEFYSKKQVLIAIGTTIAAAINIGLNLVFIPKYGYIAAAYTTLASYMCLFLIHFVFVSFLRKTKWYDTKFFVCAGLFSTALAFFVSFLYGETLKRYIFIGMLIVAFAFFAILNMKTIKKAIKERNIEALLSILEFKK